MYFKKTTQKSHWFLTKKQCLIGAPWYVSDVCEFPAIPSKSQFPFKLLT